MVGGERLTPLAEQVRRIAALRAGVGGDFFINARTDLFLKAKPEAHDEALVDQAIERGKAYAVAGATASSFRGLADLALVERICARSTCRSTPCTLPGGRQVGLGRRRRRADQPRPLPVHGDAGVADEAWPERRSPRLAPLRRHHLVRGPDLSTVLRNICAPTRRITATHSSLPRDRDDVGP